MKEQYKISPLILLILLIESCFIFHRSNNDYSKRNKMPVQGIDISHHQGNIDWDALKNEKFAFVFIKATQGTTFTDPEFAANLKKAKSSGHETGAYHFFSFCKTGAEQADHFIAVVPKDENVLPILDLEFDDAYECGKSSQEIVKEVNTYIEKIKNHYGRTPLLYMPVAFYKQYAMGEFTNCRFWIRNIQNKPELPNNAEWHFWQYGDKGKVKGIEGYVDLNAFNGDTAGFKKFMHEQ